MTAEHVRVSLHYVNSPAFKAVFDLAAEEKLPVLVHHNITASWLVCDYYFLDRFPDNYIDGDSPDDWTAFIEKYQDRVLLGTDKVGHRATYPAEVVKYYALLGRLTPEAARKICRDNVLKLIRQRH